MAEHDCLIIGAGLAGLLAASRLAEKGRQVVVLEKAAEVGGRLATRHVEAGQKAAVFDYGAQYFTVRSGRFQEWVDQWQAEGVVRRWSSGFATPDASGYKDGHPRYCGTQGMAGIAKVLARDLAVHLQAEVTRLEYADQWLVHFKSGRPRTASSLILTPPVPQSLALLEAGAVALPIESQRILSSLRYDPCLALLALLDGPSAIPEPGGLWPGGEILAWIADNQQKGISPRPAVTIHATPEYSREQFEARSETVAQHLLAEAAPWLGAAVNTWQLYRWRYSIPVWTYPEPCLFGDSPGPLVFAGDVFAGPRVEGAALSGLAAADILLEKTT